MGIISRMLNKEMNRIELSLTDPWEMDGERQD